MADVPPELEAALLADTPEGAILRTGGLMLLQQHLMRRTDWKSEAEREQALKDLHSEAAEVLAVDADLLIQAIKQGMIK